MGRATVRSMKISSITQAIGVRVLARSQSENPYTARLAQSAEEIRAAQTLRFLVFNLELNEGLEQSFATCLDVDPFDEVCDHLIVEDRRTREVVGTYRLQTGRVAAANRGYYSAQEFDLRPLESLRHEIIELGRACVHSEHRNLAVLGLLWKGITVYARERGGRYLIGCSSLTSQDPSVGARVYSDLCRKHLIAEPWHVAPLPEVACPLDRLSERPQKVPKLLAAYLSFGARICGPPAIDREFKTIDFLTFMDLEHLSRRTIERYLS
jgi:putative hemolysin